MLRQLSSGPAAELRRRALVAAGVRNTRAMRRCIGAPGGPARAAPLEHERVRHHTEARGGSIVGERCGLRVVPPDLIPGRWLKRDGGEWAVVQGTEDGEEYDLGANAGDTWLHPTVHYRGAPCLLNLLLARHGQAWSVAPKPKVGRRFVATALHQTPRGCSGDNRSQRSFMRPAECMI